MKTSDFDYHLLPHYIAQSPIEPRDASRLMLLDRIKKRISHHCFFELPQLLNTGDVLVFNDSRVIPARMIGFIDDTTSKAELLLLRRITNNIWESLAKPGKKLRTGSRVRVIKKNYQGHRQLYAQILKQLDNGIRIIQLSDETLVTEFGNTPLPPYIHEPLKEPDRYQTIYSRVNGSAAAPTAGLHFTTRLLDELIKKGIKFAFVTLHIGLDTFQPVREDDPRNHRIHSEFGVMTKETATILNAAKQNKARIIAVGTSSVRVIEAASTNSIIQPLKQDIDLFIMPGYKFKTVDAMITNFHLPKSTLIMLVSAFAGKEFILNAYQTAINIGYRFYSFGDAMLII